MPDSGSSTFLAPAWNYWKRMGIVTGGGYGSHEGCQSYHIGPDDDCDSLKCTPRCIRKCDEGHNITYKEDKSYGQSAESLANNPEHIMHELQNNGPLESGFMVYEDFYKLLLFFLLLLTFFKKIQINELI